MRFNANHAVALGAFFVPLVPVILLYLLFKDQNYFGLDGLGKFAVSTGGPIGAYLFMFWIALRNAPRLWTNPLNSSIVGSWDFVSTSSGNKKAKGTCSITDKDGGLHLSGSFKEGVFPTSAWNSDIALCGGDRLIYMHNLTTDKGTFLNIVTLHVTEANGRASRMEGNWHGFQDELKRGQIEFTRKA